MSSPLGVRRVRDPRDRPPRGCLQSRKLVSGRPVGSRHDHRRDRAKPALSHSRAKQCARPAPPDAFEMDEDHEPTSTGPSSLSLSGKSSAVRSTGYRQSPRKSQTPRRFKATVTTSSSSLLLPSSSSSLVGESRRSCFARATRMSILSVASLCRCKFDRGSGSQGDSRESGRLGGGHLLVVGGACALRIGGSYRSRVFAAEP